MEIYLLEYNEYQQCFHLNPFDEKRNDWEKPLFSNGYLPINIVQQDTVNGNFLELIGSMTGKKYSFEKVSCIVLDYLVREYEPNSSEESGNEEKAE